MVVLFPRLRLLGALPGVVGRVPQTGGHQGLDTETTAARTSTEAMYV